MSALAARREALRKRLIHILADTFLELRQHDEEEHVRLGSPEPLITSLATMLAAGLTLVRVTLAHAGHAGRGELFEPVLAMARDYEAEGWQKHRAECSSCGGH